MDEFLIGLYTEEQEKMAAADLEEFMGTLPTNELEEFLGLSKVAVAGPAEAEMPDSESGELDKAQKRVDAYVAKTQGQTPPTRDESAEAGPVSYQGPGKEAKKEAMISRVKKLAGCMTKTDEFTTPEAKKKAKVMSATMKLSKGKPLETRKKALNIASKMKVSQGIGDVGGAVGGGIGSGVGGGIGSNMGGGMETTAAMKAKIAMRTLRVAKYAPPYIKQAAASLAGREMAKLAKKGI